MRLPVFLSAPCISRSELQQLMDVIHQGYREGLASWKVKLSTLQISEEEKQSFYELFQLLIRNMNLIPSDYDQFQRKFVQFIRRQKPLLNNAHMVLSLGMFEEILMGLLLESKIPNIQTCYRWLHSLIITLTLDFFHEKSNDCKKYPSTNPHTNKTSKKESFASLQKSVLRLDELLLTSRSLEELLTDSVRFIAQVADFQRGALFWYSSVTRIVEGIYSYQVDLTQVRRVRAQESNIPGLLSAIHKTRPVYMRDAKVFFPLQYVKQFQLTSLLVTPLHGQNKQPIGFLLLDQNGDHFEPDVEIIQLVESLVSRVCMALRVKLYEHSPAAKESPSFQSLTHREQEILQMISYGYSTKDIGELLYISEHTVAEYAQAVLKKLNAKNRPEAVAKGMRIGVIQ